MDDSQFKAFLVITKGKAVDFTNNADLDAEVKTTIRDLIKAIESFEGLKNEMTGQSADSRILRKRLEQSRQETKAAEKRIEAIKLVVSGLVESVMRLSIEANKVADQDVAARLKGEIQKAAKVVVDASKL